MPLRRSVALRRITAWIAIGVAAAACVRKEVVSFSVAPRGICVGEHATVQWDVRGRAFLRAEADGGYSDQGEVPSTGARDVTPTATMTFTIFALDANPAAGRSRATKPVQVLTESAPPRGASAPCDGGVCTGSFSLPTNETRARVAKVSAGTITRGGVTNPVELTVTHGAWSATIPPGGEAAASVLAEGDWTLSTKLPAEEPPSPPPQLRVTLHFDCH